LNFIAVVLALAIGALGAVFTITTFFAGIVSGIWLAWHGEWTIVGFGLLVRFFAHPGIRHVLLYFWWLIGGPGIRAWKIGNFLVAHVLGDIWLLYVNAIMVGWGCLIMKGFPGQAKPETLTASLFWALGATTTPWVFLARTVPPGRTAPEEKFLNWYEKIGLTFLWIAYAVSAFATWKYEFGLRGWALVFSITLGLGWLEAVS
jgi:hypothetical protein